VTFFGSWLFNFLLMSCLSYVVAAPLLLAVVVAVVVAAVIVAGDASLLF